MKSFYYQVHKSWIDNYFTIKHSCSWDFLEFLFYETNIINSFNKDITQVKIEGTYNDKKDLKLPNVLNKVFPELEKLELWHMKEIHMTTKQVWPKKLSFLKIFQLNSKSLEPITNSNITHLELDKSDHCENLNIEDLTMLKHLNIYKYKMLNLSPDTFKNNIYLQNVELREVGPYNKGRVI